MDISAIFMKICNMSLTSAYCIAAVVVLRLLLKRQPKIFAYLLWSVVLFRLLCPFSLSGSYSLLRMDTDLISRDNFTGYRGARIAAWLGYTPLTGDDMHEMNGDGIDDVTAVAEDSDFYEREATRLLQNIFTIGGWIWIAGMVSLIVYSVWTTLRFRQFLQGASQLKDDVLEMEELGTPFVFGVVRPRIYLPAHLQDRERMFVLGHERVHVARKDHLIKILAWGALCLHWFNPAVWLAFKLMEKDMEMSCDEAVIRKLGSDVKKEYSQTLLSLSCGRMKLGGCPIAFGEGAVKSRVQNILSYHKRTAAAAALVAVLLCAAVIGLSMNPVSAADDAVEEQLQFVRDYADAFCARDGDALVGLYIDEDTAFENVIEVDYVDGGYTFGYSSPWPLEYRYLIDEGKNRQDEGAAQIWYYAWTSDPHIAVWKEEIEFSRTSDGYRVTDSELRWLDSISSAEEFMEAYRVAGEYWFVDYVEIGFVEAINVQTQYDLETGDGTDRNAVYRNPETAAEWILNLTDGVSEATMYNSNGQAMVQYTFADGSSVEIPMYDANFNGMTATGSDLELEDVNPISTQVWIPDLDVWNEQEP